MTVSIHCTSKRTFPRGKFHSKQTIALRVGDAWFCQCCKRRVRVVW